MHDLTVAGLGYLTALSPLTALGAECLARVSGMVPCTWQGGLLLVQSALLVGVLELLRRVCAGVRVQEPGSGFYVAVRRDQHVVSK